jgi:2-oxoglutarate dehydrogenase E1 component
MGQRLDFIQQANAAYIEQVYARYRQDPDSVPEEWALFFAGFELAETRSRVPIPEGPAARPTGGAYALVMAYRELGHRVARLDPLGLAGSTREPLLELPSVGLTEADLDREVDWQPFRGARRGALRELVQALRETYCGTLGIEYMELSEARRRDWWQERMEPGRNRPEIGAEERVRILERLLSADGFEGFLHARYPGQKRFSLEGGGALIPMLDVLVEAAGEAGVEQVVIGMPHRGRLNVLANIVGKPLERIFAEFESSFLPPGVQDYGDVKYHLGFASEIRTRGGRTVHLGLHFNPSHLEFVNPVVLGSMRAKQEYMGDATRGKGLPVLLHGDAAFAGEGIVPESLALAQLPHYETGGTVHIVVNNQVGFTTSPSDARVSRYCTDIARVVEAPVLHVNGDDPEAAVHAVRLALEYRQTFHSDVIIDLVCYRRHGHNELDDPSYTQPVMYKAIAGHIPAAERYAGMLAEAGVLDAGRLAALKAEVDQRFADAHGRRHGTAAADPAPSPTGAWKGLQWAGDDWSAETAVPRATLERIVRAGAAWPEGFHAHPRAARLLQERVAGFEADRVDWGAGEMLAYGSLVLEGHPVRLTGQDSGRGTFSHRHSVLHDTEDGRRHVPLQHLDPAQAPFTVVDTMLSEAACLGFEYGYAIADPRSLVVWEAQFGDFTNVAQVVVDQFIASGESKWRRMCGLVLLLPHGYEGQGPEHSSARLERFLELCADGNIQVANLTTPAQFFHALRRQLHRPFRKPLVVMSPKSLLRHKLAVSKARDFSDDTFHPVLDDGTIADPRRAESLLVTSGRFYYTLLEARGRRGLHGTPIVRLEQLYPFPAEELQAILARYPKLKDMRWVQEEPANMGAWRHLRHRFESILPVGVALQRVARRASPTPATGYYHMHAEQENALLDRAFQPGVIQSAPRRRPKLSREASGARGGGAGA